MGWVERPVAQAGSLLRERTLCLSLRRPDARKVGTNIEAMSACTGADERRENQCAVELAGLKECRVDDVAHLQREVSGTPS